MFAVHYALSEMVGYACVFVSAVHYVCLKWLAIPVLMSAVHYAVSETVGYACVYVSAIHYAVSEMVGYA